MSLEIRQIPALTDNYIYLLRDTEHEKTAVVDPSEAAPVINALRQHGWKLDFIVNTHHHWDHTGGNEELKRKTGCQVWGPAADAHRTPGFDFGLHEGDRFTLGSRCARILEIHGHTLGHIALVFESEKAMFCGDTLFSLGCGRLFEGTPEMMWESLCKLRAFSDDTKVYCAHEYTAANAAFALSLTPHDAALKEAVQKVEKLRKEKKSTVPSLLSFEKKFNPFLKADDSDFKKSLGLEGLSPVEVFARVRKRKDEY